MVRKKKKVAKHLVSECTGSDADNGGLLRATSQHQHRADGRIGQFDIDVKQIASQSTIFRRRIELGQRNAAHTGRRWFVLHTSNDTRVKQQRVCTPLPWTTATERNRPAMSSRPCFAGPARRKTHRVPLQPSARKKHWKQRAVNQTTSRQSTNKPAVPLARPLSQPFSIFSCSCWAGPSLLPRTRLQAMKQERNKLGSTIIKQFVAKNGRENRRRVHCQGGQNAKSSTFYHCTVEVPMC